MIIDTHVHYTEPESAARPYLWPAGSVFPISAESLLERAAALGVQQVVQVTPSCMGWDNRYSFEGALAHPGRVFGVVGRFDPFADGLPERLAQFMQQPKVIGVRHTLHHDWAADWLATKRLDPFLAEAERQDVPVFLYAPDQTADLLDTVRRYPAVRFVIDHTALQHTGDSIEQVFAQWPAVMQLGALPNVWLKVSYFPEAAARFEPYPFPSARQRFQRLYEAIGAGRMVWGSNFTPVDHLSSWGDAVRFVREECAFLTPADRAAILGRNFAQAFPAQPG